MYSLINLTMPILMVQIIYLDIVYFTENWKFITQNTVANLLRVFHKLANSWSVSWDPGFKTQKCVRQTHAKLKNNK